MYSPGATAVAMSPTLVNHRTGQLDAGDGHPSLGKRDGHAAGSDGELKRASAACEFGEPVHGRPEHLGSKHADAGRVVALGSVYVPDFRLVHAVDYGRGRTRCPTFGVRPS